MRYLTALAMLLVTGLLWANPPRRVAVPAQQFIPVQFPIGTLPTYGAAYSGQLSEESIKALVDAIDRLNATLQGKAPPQMLPAPQKVSKATAIMLRSCSSCHDASNAKTNGGGFVLTDGGKRVKLSAAQSLQVCMEIFQDRMPKKGPKLTDQEIGDIVSDMDQEIKSIRAKQ